MDNSIYASLNRQSGLMQEMQAIANNIANSDTTGFRKEGVVFSEHIARLGRQEPTLAMADASARMIDLRNGALQNTGGALDIALDGEGFFRLATPQGERLTRAGSFTLSPEGQIVSSDGSAPRSRRRHRDDPARLWAARHRTGRCTVSVAGAAVAQIGVVLPSDPASLVHEGGTRFAIEGDTVPLADAQIARGFLERSNAEPVREITRMIEVQRL